MVAKSLLTQKVQLRQVRLLSQPITCVAILYSTRTFGREGIADQNEQSWRSVTRILQKWMMALIGQGMFIITIALTFHDGGPLVWAFHTTNNNLERSSEDFPIPRASSRPVYPQRVPESAILILKHLLRGIIRCELCIRQLLGDVRSRFSAHKIEARAKVIVFGHERVVVDPRVRRLPDDVARGDDGIIEVRVAEDGAVLGILQA